MNNSRNFLAVIQFFALPFFSFFYAILKLLHVVAHTSLIAKKIVQFVCKYYTSRHDKCVDLEERGQGVPNSNFFKFTF